MKTVYHNRRENAIASEDSQHRLHPIDLSAPMTKKTRQLDKLIDELAKGKAIEKVKR